MADGGPEYGPQLATSVGKPRRCPLEVKTTGALYNQDTPTPVRTWRRTPRFDLPRRITDRCGCRPGQLCGARTLRTRQPRAPARPRNGAERR